MEFYEMIGKYYNELFPPSEAQIEFLSELLVPKSTVLDMGCATGGYAMALAERGHIVTAADLDGDMVKQLEQESEKRCLQIKTHTMDLRNIGQLKETYDLIYCIGNTLVHLDNLGEVKNFVKDAYDRLNPKGKLVIQSVNYDRILKDKVQKLPDIVREQPPLTFIRKYRHIEGAIEFIGELSLGNKDDQEKWTAQTRLLPILKEDLQGIFEEIDFSAINCFGDFKKSTFTLESPALVTLTVK